MNIIWTAGWLELQCTRGTCVEYRSSYITAWSTMNSLHLWGTKNLIGGKLSHEILNASFRACFFCRKSWIEIHLTKTHKWKNFSIQKERKKRWYCEFTRSTDHWTTHLTYFPSFSKTSMSLRLKFLIRQSLSRTVLIFPQSLMVSEAETKCFRGERGLTCSTIWIASSDNSRCLVCQFINAIERKQIYYYCVANLHWIKYSRNVRRMTRFQHKI